MGGREVMASVEFEEASRIKEIILKDALTPSAKVDEGLEYQYLLFGHPQG